VEAANKNLSQHNLSKGRIYYYLRSHLPRDHEKLLSLVTESRKKTGDHRVTLAGMIALSSICIRDCTYCAFRASRSSEERFRLTRSEILESADRARKAGIKWLILKSGDDPGLGHNMVAELVKELKRTMGFSISLSMGERDPEVYKKWYESGATHYWLRQETCDPHLYRRIKPSMFWVDRTKAINSLAKIGYSLGGGILVGLPNQSYEGLTEDVLTFLDRGLMASVIEPYLPPPETAGYDLIQKPENLIAEPDIGTMEKLVAITRVLRPDILITLSNAHIEKYFELDKGRLLESGANSMVLDFTPSHLSGFESGTPFTGKPVSGKGDIEQVKRNLENLGYEPTFDPPPQHSD